LINRRIALSIGILLSGGMLILPRIPLLFLLFLFSMLATGFRGVPIFATRKIWILLGVIFLITLVRPGEIDFESLIIRYANFIGGIFLLSIYLRSGYSELSKDLFFLFPWMSFQAILTFLLANIFPFAFTEIKIPNDSSFHTIFYIFNYHIIIEDFSGFIRPNGFFWEPGVFQIYMNLYLYLALFVFRSRKHVLLAILAVACIYSTTGLLIASILLGAASIKNLSVSNRKSKLLVILATSFIAPIILTVTAQNLEEKFFGESQGSSLIRQYDMIAGLNVISNYPILGIGFDHLRYQEVVSNYFFVADVLGLNSVPERATSNGIIYLAYTIGLPLALIFIVGIFRQKIFKDQFLIGIVLFLSMFGEALIYTPFFIMFVFSFLAIERRKLLVTNKHRKGLLEYDAAFKNI
jgi:hypothetical protein